LSALPILVQAAVAMRHSSCIESAGAHPRPSALNNHGRLLQRLRQRHSCFGAAFGDYICEIPRRDTYPYHTPPLYLGTPALRNQNRHGNSNRRCRGEGGGSEDRGFVYMPIPVCGSFTACFVNGWSPKYSKYHKKWKTTSRVILSKGELIVRVQSGRGVVMLWWWR